MKLQGYLVERKNIFEIALKNDLLLVYLYRKVKEDLSERIMGHSVEICPPHKNNKQKGEKIKMTKLRLYAPVYLDSQLTEIARMTKMPLEQLKDISYCNAFLDVDEKVSCFHFPEGLTGGEAIEYICKEHDLTILPIKRIVFSSTTYSRSLDTNTSDNKHFAYDDILRLFENVMRENDGLFDILVHDNGYPKLWQRTAYRQLTYAVQAYDHNEDRESPNKGKHGRVRCSLKTLGMTVRDKVAETFKWSAGQLTGEVYESVDNFLRTVEYFCQYQSLIKYTDVRRIELDDNKHVYFVTARYKETMFIISIDYHDTDNGIFVDKVKISQ